MVGRSGFLFLFGVLTYDDNSLREKYQGHYKIPETLQNVFLRN